MLREGPAAVDVASQRVESRREAVGKRLIVPPMSIIIESDCFLSGARR